MPAGAAEGDAEKRSHGRQLIPRRDCARRRAPRGRGEGGRGAERFCEREKAECVCSCCVLRYLRVRVRVCVCVCLSVNVCVYVNAVIVTGRKRRRFTFFTFCSSSFLFLSLSLSLASHATLTLRSHTRVLPLLRPQLLEDELDDLDEVRHCATASVLSLLLSLCLGPPVTICAESLKMAESRMCSVYYQRWERERERERVKRISY